jgi:hypothetical protein
MVSDVFSTSKTRHAGKSPGVNHGEGSADAVKFAVIREVNYQVCCLMAVLELFEEKSFLSWKRDGIIAYSSRVS